MERLTMMPGAPRPIGVPPLIRCRFNPGEMEFRRESGLTPRPAPLFPRTGAFGAAPAPGAVLTFGGEGWSTLTLKLLFEATGEEDARALTAPLHRLSAPPSGPLSPPCPVTLVWGRSWSFRGAVARLAETVDQFTSAGRALRSWVVVEYAALSADPGHGAPRDPTHDVAAERA